ncbi:uncharacterized protein BcabD6B2_13670 [Babesia caballi]|uniref:Uncharacterized protein n=1 Tax=Babesia caballi TaxID=5871 RepID=A0AAV4LQP3_BABCB|nr:hypothetical protein, conserved [Babesia caballi]
MRTILLPNLTDQGLKIGIQRPNMILGRLSITGETFILLHLLQHFLEIFLETVGQLLDIILTLDRINIFYRLHDFINTRTTNLPKLYRNRSKRRIKPRLPTAHTVLARLYGITELLGIFIFQLRMSIPQHPQERRDEHQHCVPQTLYWKVGYCNTLIGFNNSILTIIPNELLQSLGQLGNEVTFAIAQSILDLCNLRTMLGSRVFNFFK